MAGHRVKDLKDDKDIKQSGAGVLEHEGDGAAVLAGFEVGDLDAFEGGEVGGEDLDHADSRKKRRLGQAPWTGWAVMVCRTVGSPSVAVVEASRTTGSSSSTPP